MTNKERRRFTRLFDRLMTLRVRLDASLCTKLDDARQEASALGWALLTLASATGMDIDLAAWNTRTPWWRAGMLYDDLPDVTDVWWRRPQQDVNRQYERDMKARRDYVAGP